MPPSLLTGGRLGAWLRIFLVFEVVLFAIMVAGTHGWIVPLGPTTTDFVSFQAAGTLAWEGHAALVYDMEAHHAVEQALTAPGIGYQFFFYPPVFLLLLAPLSRLPYLAAFVVFQAGTLTLFLLAVRPLFSREDRGWWVPVLAFPAVFWTLGLGQNSFLTAALFCAGLRTVDSRPAVAGILFGLLCYKPHIGVLIPVALAASGNVRAFAAAAATVVFLVALSVACFGAPAWSAFFDQASSSSGVFGSGRIQLGGIVTPFASARLIGASAGVAGAIQAACAAVAVGAVWWAWRRPAPLGLRAACLLGATVLTTPVLLLYDLVLAQVALFWLLSERAAGSLGRRELAAFALVWVTPLLCLPIGLRTHVQIGPLAGATVLVWFFAAARVSRRTLARAAGDALTHPAG